MRGSLVNIYKAWVTANAVGGGSIAILDNQSAVSWSRLDSDHSFAHKSLHFGVAMTTASTVIASGSLIAGLVAATAPVSVPLYYYHNKNLVRHWPN